MVGKMNIILRRFDELSLGELYDIMVLRQQIFVVEQNCPYQDADYIDQDSLHVLGLGPDRELMGYARIVPMGKVYPAYASIGRVVINEKNRGQNLGAALMGQTNSWAKEYMEGPIKISAQSYAIPFYEKLGYEVVGDEYLEDDIPHKAMILK